MRGAPAVALAAGALALGCEGTMVEPTTGTQRVCTLDFGGGAKDCHEEATASNLDFLSTEVRVRCWQTAEGPLVNCAMLRGPDVAHYDVLEAAKKTQLPPRIVAGKPVEGWVFLVTRMELAPRH